MLEFKRVTTKAWHILPRKLTAGTWKSPRNENPEIHLNQPSTSMTLGFQIPAVSFRRSIFSYHLCLRQAGWSTKVLPCGWQQPGILKKPTGFEKPSRLAWFFIYTLVLKPHKNLQEYGNNGSPSLRLVVSTHRLSAIPRFSTPIMKEIPKLSHLVKVGLGGVFQFGVLMANLWLWWIWWRSTNFRTDPVCMLASCSMRERNKKKSPSNHPKCLVNVFSILRFTSSSCYMKKNKKPHETTSFTRWWFRTQLKDINILAILLVTFLGSLSDPCKGCWWPPTEG